VKLGGSRGQGRGWSELPELSTSSKIAGIKKEEPPQISAEKRRSRAAEKGKQMIENGMNSGGIGVNQGGTEA